MPSRKASRDIAGTASKSVIPQAQAFLASLWLALSFAPASASPRDSGSRVPIIGCASDGQLGPVAAPARENLRLPISASDARKLAYYEPESGWGVLAPRGWHCFGAYGSNGEFLYVSPKRVKSDEVFSDGYRFDGPAIEIADEFGGTSGRFEVARIIARIFPAHRDFTDNVIREEIEPPSEFPAGPFPGDKLSYQSSELVEYETPARTDGLGISGRFQKNSRSIQGVEILVGQMPEPDLISLAVRLPRDQTSLASVIIRQVEREAADGTEADHVSPRPTSVRWSA